MVLLLVKTPESVLFLLKILNKFPANSTLASKRMGFDSLFPDFIVDIIVSQRINENVLSQSVFLMVDCLKLSNKSKPVGERLFAKPVSLSNNLDLASVSKLIAPGL